LYPQQNPWQLIIIAIYALNEQKKYEYTKSLNCLRDSIFIKLVYELVHHFPRFK